eukprot:1220790-Prymnesium_polylepis.1
MYEAGREVFEEGRAEEEGREARAEEEEAWEGRAAEGVGPAEDADALEEEEERLAAQLDLLDARAQRALQTEADA